MLLEQMIQQPRLCHESFVTSGTKIPRRSWPTDYRVSKVYSDGRVQSLAMLTLVHEGRGLDFEAFVPAIEEYMKAPMMAVGRIRMAALVATWMGLGRSVELQWQAEPGRIVRPTCSM